MDEQQPTPTSFGRYKVKGTIGKGAMGVIYLAEDPVIGRQVAIKVIQLNPGISAQEIENLQTRFEREFRSAGTLSHPNIVTVHDVGKDGNMPYIAMEYVDGKTLEHVINEQRILAFEEISDLVTQICDALDFAHQHGVVHRDIKPANILLDRASRPKITDFGVAKLTESGMTHTGTMVGTPWYMSPEQVVGENVTGAADQFSVAVMTYQLLTRERPFSGERSSTVLYKIVHEEPVRPHLLNPKLMDRLDDVLMRAFQKNPSERFASCSDFATALTGALGVTPGRSPGKTGPGVTPPPTEWPTASMTLDAGLMKEWQEAAKSGARSAAKSQAPVETPTTMSPKGEPAPSAKAPPAPSAPAPPKADPEATPSEPVGLPKGAKAAKPVKPPKPPKPAKLPKPPGAGGKSKGLSAAGWLAVIGVVAVLAVGLVFLARSQGGAVEEAVPEEVIAPLESPIESAPVDVVPEPLPPELATAPPVLAAEAAPADAGGAAAAQIFRIVTRPVGASILLDGKPLEVVTPAEIEFPAGAKNLLQLELEGHKPVRWTFVADRLSDDQERTRTLYFPLAAVAVAAAAAPAPPVVAAVDRLAPAPAPVAQAERPTSPRGTLDRSLATVRGGREVAMPRKIVDAAPVYARESVPAGPQPIVILEVTLDPQGEVATAKVLRGLTAELDEIARRTSYMWKYEVAPYKGKPANTIVTSTVVFER